MGPFILILDLILGYVTLIMNEFVLIFELMKSRKDKINSKEITESFLFNLFFDSSIMSQVVKRVCTVKLFYF